MPHVPDRDLLARLLREEARQSNSFPLSFAQQRLWFFDQLNPHSALYNIVAAARLAGPVNVPALEQSLNAVIARHEALRTTFEIADRAPVQVIAPVLTIPLLIVDLRAFRAAERETELRRLVDANARRPFDLARGPLLRATLLRLDETEHVLALAVHHIVSDGWSLEIFVRELAAFYAACCEGQACLLPELPIQYADFTMWQQQWLQGPVLERQLTYWKARLAGAAVLELPVDHPRPAISSLRGHVLTAALPSCLSDSLKALAQRTNVTLFMLLLAAFQTLLLRCTNEDDIGVGTPLANRNRKELEGLIGFFVNTVVLRTDLSGNPPFDELLARVRAAALDAYAHQDVPFEMLVDQLQPQRDLSHNPLFQVSFALQTKRMASATFAGLTLTPMEVDRQSAPFDLALSAADTQEALLVSLEYNTDLFEATTIQRMLDHYRALLDGIAEDPEQRLMDLPLLAEGERHQLLFEWNDTRSDDDGDLCVHELFEAQVRRTPDSVAVMSGDEQLTYRTLNQRANQLAHYLRTIGVGTDAPVALCVDRSPELVIGLFGILKAGAGVVPIEPAYPSHRQAFMLTDCGAPVLVTRRSLLARLPECAAKTVCLDVDWRVIAEHSPREPIRQAGGADVAYLIYTSGTTDRAKAVVVEHRNLASVLRASQAQFGFTAGDVMPCMASLSFDIAFFELFNPLIVGGTTILLAHEPALDLDRLLELFDRVTVIHAVPGLMRQIVDALKPVGSPPAHTHGHPRMIFVGGDLVSPALLQQLAQIFPRSTIRVLYGPTEATIICASHSHSSGRDHGKHLIGRPLNNAIVRLYDRRRNPAAIGMPAEIYIGGAGVSRGYLNRPDLTSEKYVAIDGQRFYRTGDCARYLPDGTIEFIGRLYDQVKIRGYRVELGEVEAVLGRHAAVREAVVVADEDATRERRLIAYLVPSRECAIAVDEIRRFLRDRVPAYMIPSAFTILETLPLTANGKIDRRALPAVHCSTPGDAGCFVAPRSPLERQLTGIWTTALGLERVGVEDNFFDVGGHSLLATQVISRVREAFQVALPLRSLFENPTVSQLAVALVQRQAADASSAVVETILAQIEQIADDEARSAAWNADE